MPDLAMTAAETRSPALTGDNLPDIRVRAEGLVKTFRSEQGIVRAISRLSLNIEARKLSALVGPDGAGKTTLLRMIAGLLRPDEGRLDVLGLNVINEPQSVQSRISYMPQRFGLYEDLTVDENLTLYADLHGVPAAIRRQRYGRLMEMTNLGAFTDRLAGQLSGGMKQKLGLACTLVHSPELLLLDEPTVGVDPLSRRELWAIINQLVRDEKMSVLVSTTYLDEAENADIAIVMTEGQIVTQGKPDELSATASGLTFLVSPETHESARNLQVRLLDNPGIADARPEGGTVRVVLKSAAGIAGLSSLALRPVPPGYEDGFMRLLKLRQLQGTDENPSSAATALPVRRDDTQNGKVKADIVIEVHDLVRRFGAFIAVNHVSFEVRRGEIFGLLGPNGAGKTTTFRMLCGLLQASSGTLKVLGMDLRLARASARQKIGYMAQKFALYGQLTVMENLEFFASAYGLRGGARRQRIEWALQHFELAEMQRMPAAQLPGGFKQRLSMAAALLHEPEVLFLDEPTSGADPFARRDFWRRINDLSQTGVTVIVTTHFMEEAEYCDRALIQDSGKILAQGTPAELREYAHPEPGHTATMEDAFIRIVEDARNQGLNQSSA